jgi:L-alanine-DL-glutamate epimerase-like enolase superfamily enzyme
MLVSISASPLKIPFRAAFTHASASRALTQSVWVTARDSKGHIGMGEGCPREYVTGETLEGALAFIAANERIWLDSIADFDSLTAWIAAHGAEIDANPSAWAAVELALLDLFGRASGCTVEALLGLPPLAGQFRYTAVIGDSAPPRFEAELARYVKDGFCDFKIKLSGETGRDKTKVAALRAAGIAPERVRADANNLWEDADLAMASLSDLDFRFMALEEPLHIGDYAGMQRIASAFHCAIILDESLLRIGQLSALAKSKANWIVNLRISKMGGLLRSLQFAEGMRRAGLRMIVGAHVGETSLLSRAALTVASAARDLLVAQEGAFGTHLLERDVAEPPIMFGAGGVLDSGAISSTPGLGLNWSTS